MYKMLSIKNEISELPLVNRFLEKVGEECCFSSALLMNLTLVMEEAVSNIIFYAYRKEDKGQQIDIALSFEWGVLTVTLTDTGMAFDPTAKKDPDITLSVEERPVGGLGIFLIKKIMDEVTYTREGERNVFVMKKRIDNNRIRNQIMEVKITEGAETVITVSGRLDTNSSPEFEKAIEPVLMGSAQQVIIDCKALIYISSSGLRLFLMLQKKMSAKKGTLLLRGLSAEIKEIFNITGFSAIFKIE